MIEKQNNPAASDFGKRYDVEALVPFRKKDYQIALPKFRLFLEEAPTLLDQARTLINIVKCLWFTGGEGTISPASDAPLSVSWLEINDRMEAYLTVLQHPDTQTWSVQPAIEGFEFFIRAAFFCVEQPVVLLTSYYNRLPQRFCTSFIEAIAIAFDREALNYGVGGHELRTITLGEFYLTLTNNTDLESIRAIRVAIRNRMANLAIFQAAKDAEVTERQALLLLEESLKEDPKNRFATRLKQHISQRAAFRLQIGRFWHDTNNRIAPIKQTAQKLKLKLSSDEEIQQLLTVIERNISWVDVALRVAGVSQGSQAVVQPSSDLFQNVDPVEFCREVLVEEKLPTAKVEAFETPRKWEVAPDYLRLALHNLLCNSLEAYARRGITPPEVPMHIQINYREGSVVLRDFAGGISPELPDPFLPYISEKGIQMTTGLGLLQARGAIEQQDGTLSLLEPQPSDGAAFLIKFSKF